MKKLILVIVVLLAFFVVAILPQTNIIVPQMVTRHDFTFGGNRDYTIFALLQNDYYFVSGNKQIFSNGPTKSYAGLKKFSSSGDLIWELVEIDSTLSHWNSLAKAPDGIFWSVSSTFGSVIFPYIYRLDNNGQILWTKYLQGTRGAAIASDNNFLAVVTYTDIKSVMIFDLDGNLLYGPWNIPLEGISGLIIKDNYLYIAGHNPPGGVYINYNVELYKTDLNGNVVWHRILEDGIKPRIVFDSNDNLYITSFCAGPNSFIGWRTAKIDKESSTVIWQRFWNGDWVGPANAGNYPNFIISHPEGGCVITGELTKVGSSDANSADGAAISYDIDGNEIFKFRYDYIPTWYVTKFGPSLFDGNQLVVFGESLEDYSFSYIRQLYFTKWNNVTSVTPEPGVIPTAYLLYQNYPNPFNPITTIKFSTPHSGVLLKVFNLLGQEIETLVDEYLPSGTYNVQFTGQNLPSGIYIYELRTEKITTTKKMVVLK